MMMQQLLGRGSSDQVPSLGLLLLPVSIDSASSLILQFGMYARQRRKLCYQRQLCLPLSVTKEMQNEETQTPTEHQHTCFRSLARSISCFACSASLLAVCKSARICFALLFERLPQHQQRTGPAADSGLA
jgi:hypothetical protein